MSTGKSNSKDNSSNKSFLSEVASSITRAVCESTKGSYGDVCPHDVNVGGKKRR